MPVELVHTFAADGLRLDGALHLPRSPAENEPSRASPDRLRAVLVLHGTGGNFYHSRFLAYMAQRFTALGSACLVANTRGHDQIATALVVQADGTTGSRLVGSAYERVDDCRLDIAAWLKTLRGAGYDRTAICGHSLGAVKAVYAATHDHLPGVEAILAVSPPRLSYAEFAAGPRSAGFLADIAAAERHVAEGRPEALMEIRFPLPYVITAAGYLDKYGPAETYNILHHAGALPIPTLFTYGGLEVRSGEAFRGMPEALEELKARGANLSTAVISGGDHNYTGVQDDLMNTIERWLRSRPR